MRVNLSTQDLDHARNICKSVGYSDIFLDSMGIDSVVSLALLLSDTQTK